jgi:two-component system, OmpR family, response regulator
MAGELKRILYVDDEPDIRAVAKMALENVGGFTVLICASGAEALQRAAEFAPDLILLDVMMPEMDGPATLAALRRLPALAATPVLFFTAKVQTGEVEQFKSLGALDVVPKPFKPMLLSQTLRDIWERAVKA